MTYFCFYYSVFQKRKQWEIIAILEFSISLKSHLKMRGINLKNFDMSAFYKHCLKMEYEKLTVCLKKTGSR